MYTVIFLEKTDIHDTYSEWPSYLHQVCKGVKMYLPRALLVVGNMNTTASYVARPLVTILQGH